MKIHILGRIQEENKVETVDWFTSHDQVLSFIYLFLFFYFF